MPGNGKPENSSSTSAVQPALPVLQEALFQDVLRLLEDNRIPYVVSGAFALREHTGICRETKDLDVFMEAQDVPRTLDLLSRQGFRCEICDPVWLAKAHRDDFFVDVITGMSNAVIVVDRTWIERAFPAVVFGVQSRVLAPEELIASKLFVTRRERFDGADIAHIVYGTRGQIDWNRVKDLVGEHWEILLWSLILFRYVYPAHSHFVPMRLWNDLMSRFTDVLNRPEPTAPFRGSLIDENMFAIDVESWGLENVQRDYRHRRLSALSQFTGAMCGPCAPPEETV
jgi:hypothetical protein